MTEITIPGYICKISEDERRELENHLNKYQYQYLLDGSRPYTVTIKRRNNRNEYDVRITIDIPDEVEELNTEKFNSKSKKLKKLSSRVRLDEGDKSLRIGQMRRSGLIVPYQSVLVSDEACKNKYTSRGYPAIPGSWGLLDTIPTD